MAELFTARLAGVHGFERTVVIKKILPHLAADKKFVSMFIDEARISSHLDHPKIVQIFELEASGDDLFIVMEYVEGFDVLQVMRGCQRAKTHLPVELCAYIAHDVLDALEFAHATVDQAGTPRGIVHRDISPGNILVSHRGDIKLTDFGIAAAAERTHKTEVGALKGKFSYMSPEQVRGEPVDARSDVFAAGVVLCEMLMARRLFAAANDLDLLMMVRDARLDRLDKYGGRIPLPLRAIAERALQRRAEDRWASAGEFRDAIADWLFESRFRVRPSNLAEFIRRVPPVKPAPTPVTQEIIDALSGPHTRAMRLEAKEKARIGRERYEAELGVHETPADQVDGIPVPVDDETSDAILIIGEAPKEESVADDTGPFSARSPASVLCDIAADGRTGRLVVEGDAVLKESYFHAGHPVFIRSNVLSERFGEYLVSQGVLTRDELERALDAMPHFGGRLGDTLIGLGLMQPLDAVRQLGRQVRRKLVEVCAWQTGTFRWYEGERNPWPALALHLDTFEILGAGCLELPLSFLDPWAQARASKTPVTNLPRFELTRFHLGTQAGYVYNCVDSEHTVAELASRFSMHDRVMFIRILYLLVETGNVRFA